jgi:GYF domain 2
MNSDKALGGQRIGPVPTDKLRELLATQTIDGETPIWRRGMADWQPLGNTEVGTHLKETPPHAIGHDR